MLPSFAASTPMYSFDAAAFDGDTYLAHAAALTGVTDSKKFTMSYWYKAVDGIDTPIALYGYNSNFITYIDGGAVAQTFYGADSGLTYILRVNWTGSAHGAWHHVMGSFDLADAAKRHVCIDGVPIAPNYQTYTNDTLYLSNTDWRVGFGGGGVAGLNGSLAEVAFWPGSYLDLSVQANRDKFIGGANGRPIRLGADASLPLGVAAAVYLHLDYGEEAANFALNRGTGGNFTVTGGSLTTSATRP